MSDTRDVKVDTHALIGPFSDSGVTHSPKSTLSSHEHPEVPTREAHSRSSSCDGHCESHEVILSLVVLANHRPASPLHAILLQVWLIALSEEREAIPVDASSRWHDTLLRTAAAHRTLAEPSRLG